MNNSWNYVAFSIFGTALDFEKISKNLGFGATDRHRAGDQDPVGQIFDRDLWSLKSPFSKTEPLEKHVNWIVEQIAPKKEVLRRLSTSNQLQLYCGITQLTDQGGFIVSPNISKLLGEIGAELTVSIISPTES